MAKLHFKYGAMNSGKSDTLIKAAYNYTERGLRVMTMKPAIDSKGGDAIVARAGGRWKVDLLARPEDDVTQLVLAEHTAQPVSCVLVDESQFLTPQHIDQLFTLAKRHDISVICYGLRADFRRELFPGAKRLFEIADNIEKLPTMCRCGSQAEFNCRKVDDQFVFTGDQVAIDGEGSVTYDSLCGQCYLDEEAKA